MPLYKKRVKKSIFSQDTNNSAQMVSSEFKQPSSSQKALEEILNPQGKLNKSPIYPEVFPRCASEPNESAFVDDSFEKTELKLENDASDRKNSETPIENSLPYEISYTSNDTSEKETVLQEIADVDNMNGLSTENIEILAPTDKIKQSNLVENAITPEKNNMIAISEVKSIEKPKKKKSIMHPMKSSKNKKKNSLDSDVKDFKENIPPPSNNSESHLDLNASLNSSISSQVSLNDPPVKEAFKNFLIKKKVVKEKNIISSQTSDISLNDPVIRDTYSQFMTKKEKFARVNTPKGLTHYDKMKWLQGQRNVGVYVHCDSCDKIRFLEEINDPTVLPDKWYCKDNSGEERDSHTTILLKRISYLRIHHLH